MQAVQQEKSPKKARFSDKTGQAFVNLLRSLGSNPDGKTE